MPAKCTKLSYFRLIPKHNLFPLLWTISLIFLKNASQSPIFIADYFGFLGLQDLNSARNNLLRIVFLLGCMASSGKPA